MNKFTLRIIDIINSELRVVERKFDRLEDAIEHGIKATCHSFKIYDHRGHCHHNSHHHHHHGPYG